MSFSGQASRFTPSVYTGPYCCATSKRHFTVSSADQAGAPCNVCCALGQIGNICIARTTATMIAAECAVHGTGYRPPHMHLNDMLYYDSNADGSSDAGYCGRLVLQRRVLILSVFYHRKYLSLLLGGINLFFTILTVQGTRVPFYLHPTQAAPFLIGWILTIFLQQNIY